ncbi:uncharacterized protein BDZ99DRAFT_511146 [Mytilinidion resinicola]|uniref:DUF2415 domain-containing protein n=1 Tax=Mytilinidion resinicola TaxID=574789 RepID=A0A6A6YAA4_9PEZI|nr:uncharacterized protein BDZ99DRAFT_511146 [Mytilinidion resinicola]KAF2805752.1 hypothetical protein BDZ99DRAFT_511146 [Mytilinidion resinicola]
MAVDDFLCRDTDTFVLPSKAFYPLSIPLSHYQLRHFISSPEQDLIYYANGQDVYCLNTVTKTQAHIATLTFDARCTAAGYGWVCVGGAEDGCFAAIKVEAYPPPNPADVDALLPLDLPNRTALPPPPTLRSASSIRVERIGSEIVNSISIHKLPGEGEEEDEVVAVLTSNDKTVRIYSLTQSVEVAELKLPFAMNHATISPDGQFLIAVGDYQQVFFFQRSRPSILKTPEGRSQLLPAQWSNFAEAQLYVPPGSVVAGYFTTAWSPSGALCAVGSECGYITVFDTELLNECDYAEDAVVQIVKSSRPDSVAGPGAVRTMLFSPQPWDLLVWSEDQARVCVADIRSGLSVKQVLALDPMEDDLEKIDIADFDIDMQPEVQQTQSELRDISEEADFIRRYRRALDSEGNSAASNYATDYLEAAADRRRLHRQLGVVESDNDPHGLTPDERQVLDAIMTRQRDEPRERGATPRSIRYPNTSDLGLFRTAFNNSSSERSERNGAGQNASSHGRGDFTDYVRVRSLLRERALDPERASYQPRRQASVVLSGGRSSAANSGSTDSLTGTPTSRSPNPIPPHARRADSSESSSSDPWRTIEAAMARSSLPESLPPRAPVDSPAALTSQVHRIRQLQAARDRIRSLREHPGSDYEIAMMRQGPRRQTAGAHDPRSDPHNGVRTAGLAMSQDGRKLYAGTEDGIFEFNINLRERKLFPAIVPR